MPGRKLGLDILELVHGHPWQERKLLLPNDFFAVKHIAFYTHFIPPTKNSDRHWT